MQYEYEEGDSNLCVIMFLLGSVFRRAGMSQKVNKERQ